MWLPIYLSMLNMKNTQHIPCAVTISNTGMCVSIFFFCYFKKYAKRMYLLKLNIKL